MPPRPFFSRNLRTLISALDFCDSSHQPPPPPPPRARHHPWFTVQKQVPDILKKTPFSPFWFSILKGARASHSKTDLAPCFSGSSPPLRRRFLFPPNHPPFLRALARFMFTSPLSCVLSPLKWLFFILVIFFFVTPGRCTARSWSPPFLEWL